LQEQEGVGDVFDQGGDEPGHEQPEAGVIGVDELPQRGQGAAADRVGQGRDEHRPAEQHRGALDDPPGAGGDDHGVTVRAAQVQHGGAVGAGGDPEPDPLGVGPGGGAFEDPEGVVDRSPPGVVWTAS
jgi:hypothetical protein